MKPKRATPPPPARRRLVVTVCPREAGALALSLTRGGPRHRLDARAILDELRGIVLRRRLMGLVEVRPACAGGCHRRGPNVSVAAFPVPAPGECTDEIAVAWRSYVGSLGDVSSLSSIIDDNLR